MRRVVEGFLICCLAAPVVTGEMVTDERRTLASGLELHQPREDVLPEELDIYSAYQEARELEAEIVRMVREIRASELTMVQRQTLKRSLESVLMPLSERADVDREVLTATATSAEAVERYQDELSVVMRETDAIVSNARDLLESLLAESVPETPVPKEDEAKPEEQEQEESSEPEKEESAEPEAREPQDAKPSGEQLAAREKQRQAERERQEERAKEAMEQTELHLEKALEEIQAAREEVAKEKDASRKIEEAQAAQQNQVPPAPLENVEAKESKEAKAEQWKELEVRVEEAERAVGAVVKKVKAMRKVSDVEIREAETALEALRAAMASVQQADASARESAAESTGKKTGEAVRAMEAARSTMESAVNAMRSLQKSRKGDGGGGDGSIVQKQVLGELAGADSGNWLDLTAQMRGEDLDIIPGETPMEERPDLWAGIEELERAPAAHRFSASTPGDVWIFLGDWHVLSRYDNEGRTNIQKVYPPESFIDLSAQYVSGDGHTLRWEYESYLPPMVVPHAWESWKIYYFHTELIFEEETEAWLAIGSDDRSDLWINDLPVWHSANRHKGWNPAEGFRKVVFREGRNKVLLRLENGQAGLGFSVFLNLKR